MYGISPPQFEEEDYVKKGWFSSIFKWITSRIKTVNVTTAYSVASDIYWIRCDATSGAFNVTLPPVSEWWGRQIGVIKTDASSNAVTVLRAGSDTFLGGATRKTLRFQGSTLNVISNGSTVWDVKVAKNAVESKDYCVLDGTTDDTVGLNAGYAAANAADVPYILSNGTARFTSQLVWNGAVDVTGESRESAILKKDGDFVGILHSASTQARISNFTLDAANDPSVTSHGISITAMAQGLFERLTVVRQGGDGIVINAPAGDATMGVLRDITSVLNGRDGLRIIEAYALRLDNLDLRGNGCYGLNVVRGDFHNGKHVVCQQNGTSKTITGATQADPVVITATAHGFANGDLVQVAGIVGMTEINNRDFIIAGVAANTFELQGEDGTGHTAYTSGGTAIVGGGAILQTATQCVVELYGESNTGTDINLTSDTTRNYIIAYHADSAADVKDAGTNNYVQEIGIFPMLSAPVIGRIKRQTNVAGLDVQISGGAGGAGVDGVRGGQVNITGGDADGDTNAAGARVAIQGGGPANTEVYGPVQLCQAGGGVIIGGATTDYPSNDSVGLEFKGANKGLVVPVLTEVQRDALTAINGMVVYNTTAGKFQGREAGAWTNLI